MVNQQSVWRREWRSGTRYQLYIINSRRSNSWERQESRESTGPYQQHQLQRETQQADVPNKLLPLVAEMGRHKVYAVTSAEKGRTHTIFGCASASGHVLPPVMIFPRKQTPPANFREGTVAQTLFANSANGWINNDLFLQWFKFFLANIPPTQPMLLIMDGHGTHMSIELIELARSSGVHLLCLPSHTTHILQPLDVGVFRSFKSNFSKACSKYLAAHPGRVITSDKLASLIAEAWPLYHI